jgi:thioredoxin reductase (NADPH)
MEHAEDRSARQKDVPNLSAAEIDRLLRFGQVQPYRKGQPLFVTGEIARGMFVFKTGRVRVRRRDPLGHLAPIVEQGPGDFVAEVGQLSGRPALVDVHAEGDMEALLIPPENLRTVMIAKPKLADRIMCALILRRVALIETGAGGRSWSGPRKRPMSCACKAFHSQCLSVSGARLGD